MDSSHNLRWRWEYKYKARRKIRLRQKTLKLLELKSFWCNIQWCSQKHVHIDQHMHNGLAFQKYFFLPLHFHFTFKMNHKPIFLLTCCSLTHMALLTVYATIWLINLWYGWTKISLMLLVKAWNFNLSFFFKQPKLDLHLLLLQTLHQPMKYRYF
jgi:hypothetical protein